MEDGRVAEQCYVYAEYIYIYTYLHYNKLCLFACTVYRQPTQHNLLSFLLSKISSLDTFLPSGIHSFPFWWGYYENVLQRDKAARKVKNCSIHLYEGYEIVQLAETQSGAVTAWPGAGEGKWDGGYLLDIKCLLGEGIHFWFLDDHLNGGRRGRNTRSVKDFTDIIL